ncbi:MAG: hypothetical protein ACPF9D_09210, partial [Owenweeksia sp.]
MRNLASILLALLWATLNSWGQESHALFIRNDGQWTGTFNYKLRLNSGAVFFEDNGYTISLDNSSDFRHDHDHDDHDDPKAKSEDLLKGHVLKVKFLYANPFPTIEGYAKCSFYQNYFLGNDPALWKSTVPVFRQLNYSGLYPGIDVHFKGRGSNLKYDFYLAPNADPRLIQMQYNGAISITAKGDHLFVETSLGTLQEFIPEAYQEINGTKRNVPCSYILQGNIVKFKLGAYDPDHPLIIDPELVFSSFSGSSADNWGFTATFDEDG